MAVVGTCKEIVAASKNAKFNTINWDKVNYDETERNAAIDILTNLCLALDIKSIGELGD